MRRTLLARKLLVASLGVATVSYVGCADSSSNTGDGGNAAQGPDGNLMAPPPDAQDDVTTGPVGNLMAPPPPDATDAPSEPADAPFDVFFGPEGNLMAPPPDAADDAPEGG